MSFSQLPARPRLLLLAAALLPTLSLGAQASPAPAAADPDRAIIARLQSDLRNLVTAQEMHFSQKEAYALSVTALAGLYRASSGVTVELVNAGTNSYGAAARFAGRPGNCVIYVGLSADASPRTELEKKRFAEGEPACDGDGITERRHWAVAAEHQAASMLVGVAKLQERQFGRTGAYASDIGALAGFKPQQNTVITIERLGDGDRASFLATATDSRYPGVSCVLQSGWGRYGDRAATAAEKKRPTGDLFPACDAFK